MAERLFQGQLRPQAQPINNFINPQQFRRSGAAQQPLLGKVSQLATLQRGGTSGVRGFNQFEQMASALAPLSKNLTSLADKGFKRYAKGSIEAGYYEEMRNQQVQGVMNLQQNQEAGAAEAASTIGALEKIDPVAGALLREANPWKAIGRRRAMAQMAAGQVSSVLNEELTTNAGQLSGIRPGSPALMNVKQDLTSKILKQFQLTGSEPEAAYYVTPVVNKAWDNFTQKQSQLYSAELEQNTIEATNASVASAVMGLVQDGIDVGGVRLRVGDEGWADAAALQLTYLIDQGLGLLGGKSRVEAMKKIKNNLGQFALVPGVGPAIGAIRLGDRNMPIEKRPLWRNANTAELMDYTTGGMRRARLLNEEQQASSRIEIEDIYNRRLAGLDPNSEEFKKGLAELTKYGIKELGNRNAASIVQEQADEQTELFNTRNAPTFEEQIAAEEAIGALTPSGLNTPEKKKEAINAARILARASSPDPKVQADNYRKYVDEINKKEALYAKMPTGAALESTLTRLVNEDMVVPEIAALKPKSSFDRFADFRGGTTAPATPFAGVNGKRYLALQNKLRGLYATQINAGYSDYFEKNPTATEVPIAKQVQIRESAAVTVRDSDAWKTALADATAKPPPPKGTDGTPQSYGGGDGPKSRDASASITIEQAKRYREEAVINQFYIGSEMDLLKNNQPVSKQLYDLARSAGTSTDRFLLEQLTFYPKLDPNGAFGKVLQERIERARQTSTPAAANENAATDPMGNQSFVGRDPGSWLLSMFERPAAAGTLPPSVRPMPVVGESGSSNQVVNGNWVTPSGYEIVQYVTGDVTAPHDGDAVIVDPAGHGGAAYHNHYEFATVAGRKRAAAAFRAAGFRVSSEYRPGDPGSHGVGRGLDVAPGWSPRMPGRLPDTVQDEAKWSRDANAILGFIP